MLAFQSGRYKSLTQSVLHISIFMLLFGCITVSGCAPVLQNKKTPAPVANENQAKVSALEVENINKINLPPESNQKNNEQQTEKALGSLSTAVTTENLSSGQPTTNGEIQRPIEIETPPQLPEQSHQAILDRALEYCELAQNLWEQGELEPALEALDQAYAFILDLQNIDTQEKLIQQKEDLRFLISRRILEIYASRHIVVNGDHNAIPVEINHHVQTEIDRFTKGAESKFFKSSYQRSGRYRSYIVEELRKAGLPEELSWLPLIESGYKVNALSKARALGLWQFIPSTGYKFGLKRNTYVDNRLDPAKSTQAAIAYLKELHQIFGDWATVLAAYNCGEGRVLREIRSQNINYLDNFWDLYKRLPRETARYVPRFIATLHIIRNPSKYGLQWVTLDPPHQYETATISKRTHLDQIAQAIDVPKSILSSLNPELRYKVTPPEAYDLKVPIGKGSVLLSSIDRLPSYKPPQPNYVYHRVRKGETVSSIASKYRTSARRIAQTNRLNRRYTIIAGQRLKIPVRGSVSVRSASTSRQRVTQANTRHRVRKGDSLWNIARRYQTTVHEIKRLNGLKGSSLSIGQVLKIRGTAKVDLPNKKDLKAYRVRSGDSPYQIARKNRMSLASFLQINRLTPRSKIYPGQKVYVE